jgi:HAD superfamily hydrolase (TIGR01490 family)
MLNIFDVDYTVLKKTSVGYFLHEALRERLITLSQIKTLPFDLLRYKFGSLNHDFIEEAVKHIAGIDEDAFKKVLQNSFERRMKKGIYTDALRLIEEMKKRGEKVMFATSSFSIIIEPLARFLDIDETLATNLEFAQGKTTGRIVGNSLFGEKKKDAVAAWLLEHKIDPRDTRFYSDSYTDIPLLAFAGEAIAVNPDRILKREAKKRGWKILRFQRTLL